MGIIAPGTGLGESFLTTDGNRRIAHACEGGHADFAPTCPIEMRLLDYLSGIYGHVSFERVCSGMGLSDIYRFLRDGEGVPEPDWLADELDGIDDAGPVIVNTALDGTRSSALCDRTLDIFVSALGAEAGNLALTVMATGGIYLGGGIPPRILGLLDQGRFMDAFTHKGRMASLLAEIPVHVILNPKAALQGAMQVALNS
jgi:glucokinase